eukprot:GCRY01000984.1.p1 GENE.GCRY01000984.1~~GCRY01000984.1.p1  ORF type:complete len:177 (-),score=16.48 GCRY01000984.1:94-624(-)
MSLWKSAPKDINEIVDIINKLNDSEFEGLCGVSFVSNVEALKIETKDKPIIRFLHVIFKNAKQQSLGNSILMKQLNRYTNLSGRAVTIIGEAYQKANEAISEKKDFTFGFLRHVDWRVGVSMTSSLCDDLKFPYIHLVVSYTTSGQLQNQGVRFSIPQFKEFSRQFQELAMTLDTL